MAPPRYDFGPTRRRRSPLGFTLIALLVLVVALLAWLGLRDTAEPRQKIEQDVTNEVLK